VGFGEPARQVEEDAAVAGRTQGRARTLPRLAARERGALAQPLGGRARGEAAHEARQGLVGEDIPVARLAERARGVAQRTAPDARALLADGLTEHAQRRAQPPQRDARLV